MQLLIQMSEAALTLQEREKQAPSETMQVMFERTLALHRSELDDSDYFYLSVLLEVLSSAKNRSTANENAFLRFGAVAHACNELTLSTSC